MGWIRIDNNKMTWCCYMRGAIASATAAWAILLDRSAVARKRPNSRRLPLAGVRKPLTKTDLYLRTRTDAIAAIGRTAFERCPDAIARESRRLAASAGPRCPLWNPGQSAAIVALRAATKCDQ